MDKLKIGIPKAIHYYYYGVFWQHFFEHLHFEVIISPDTNKEILARGMNLVSDEMCLSMKIYFGHIDYLQDKCDYILVPRIDRFDDDNQTCTNFLALYDLVANLLNVKLLHYNIDNDKDLLDGLMSIGDELKISRREVLGAYDYAETASKKYWDELYKKQRKLLLSNHKKVLIVSHAYNSHDDFVGNPVTSLLVKNNLEILYSDYFNDEVTNKLSSRLSGNLYWKFSKDTIGAIELCDTVDGIVFLSTFPCGLDSLVNELVMRKIDKPYLNIIVDDLTSLAGLETRIESFADLIYG